MATTKSISISARYQRYKTGSWNTVTSTTQITCNRDYYGCSKYSFKPKRKIKITSANYKMSFSGTAEMVVYLGASTGAQTNRGFSTNPKTSGTRTYTLNASGRQYIENLINQGKAVYVTVKWISFNNSSGNNINGYVTPSSLTITYEEVGADAHYYNGTSWQTCTLKIYDGGTWVEPQSFHIF